MTSIVTHSRRVVQDHFEPEAMLDPQEQKKLRGHLEQIDYAAFAANREVIGKTLGATDMAKFERLAICAAHARSEWVSAALAITERTHTPSSEEVARLTVLRSTYDELAEAYGAMRRMVERGYLSFSANK